MAVLEEDVEDMGRNETAEEIMSVAQVLYCCSVLCLPGFTMFDQFSQTLVLCGWTEVGQLTG